MVGPHTHGFRALDLESLVTLATLNPGNHGIFVFLGFSCVRGLAL